MYYIFFLFSSIFFAVQSMEPDKEIISSPFGKITSSYFLHNQEYMERLAKIISKDWKLENSHLSFVNLIGDVSYGKMKKVYTYMGPQKIITFPYNHRSLRYTGKTALSTLQNMCVEKVYQYTAVGKISCAETSKKLSDDLLKKLSQYTRFAGANFTDGSTKNNIVQDAVVAENDYKKEVCILLQDACSFINCPFMNAGEIKLQGQINLYLKGDTPYNKKEIEKLLKDICSLDVDKATEREKIKKKWEKRAYSYLLTVSFGGKFKSHDLLQNAVTWLVCANNEDGEWTENNFRLHSGFYNWIIDDSFQKYPLYAANILVNLAVTTKDLRLKEEALGIVALYGMMQSVIDYNLSIVQRIAKIHLSLHYF